MADPVIDPSTYPDPLSILLAPRPKAPGLNVDPNAPVPGMRPVGTPPPAPVAAPTPTPPPAPVKAPPVTDDPNSIPLPKPVDLNNNPVTQLLQRRAALEQQRAGIPVPTYQQNKPRWYDRLAGLALGTLAGPQAASNVASEVVNSRFNRAKAQYQRQVAPIDQQLEIMKGDLPGAEAEGRLANEAFDQNFKNAEELRRQAGETRQEEYAKAREARYATPRTANEARAMASKADDPDEKQRLNDLADQMETAAKFGKVPNSYVQAVGMAAAARTPEEKQFYNGIAKTIKAYEDHKLSLEHPGREDKTATKGQFQSVNNKRKQGFDAAHRDFEKATKDLDPRNPADAPAFQDAHDRFVQSMQDAQNAWEEGVTTLGGDAGEHQDVTKWKGFGSKGSPDNAGNAGSTKPESNTGSPVAAAPKPTSSSAAAPPAPSGATMTDTVRHAPSAPKGQPMGYQGDQITFNGKKTTIASVRRNPQTGEHAYQIDGKWYTDSELKPAK